MNIDLLTLKLFVAVVEEQRVAEAAERARIADLEKAAKVQLFRRHLTGPRDLAQMDRLIEVNMNALRWRSPVREPRRRGPATVT